jgi:hypothetical protein
MLRSFFDEAYTPLAGHLEQCAPPAPDGIQQCRGVAASGQQYIEQFVEHHVSGGPEIVASGSITAQAVTRLETAQEQATREARDESIFEECHQQRVMNYSGVDSCGVTCKPDAAAACALAGNAKKQLLTHAYHRCKYCPEWLQWRPFLSGQRVVIAEHATVYDWKSATTEATQDWRPCLYWQYPDQDDGPDR